VLDVDLALGDDGFFVAMNKFDRFLDRDDVAAEVRVDVIEQCRERGGFSGAGGAGDEHEAGAHVAKFFHHFWHAK
jgi:hypothetical protein